MSTSERKCAYPGCVSTDTVIRRGLCRQHRRLFVAPVIAPATCSPIDGISIPSVQPIDPLEADLRVRRLKAQVSEYKGLYGSAQERIEQLENDLGVFKHLQEHAAPVKIVPQVPGGTNEATPILVASDWHIEQRVTREETNGLNEFNLEIAEKRANRFFTAGLRLIRLLNQDVAINTVVLGLLGDFITGQIHGAANAEKNQLKPTQAIVFAQNLLVGGIEFILNNSAYRLKIICKMGNHSRNTDKSRIGVENGHSYEYLMYLFLKATFKGNDRVDVIIDDSFHTYVEVYDEVFRFNHGHTIKFQGGVGGLFIPAYKKIDKWDKAKPATRTVIGHHHTYLDGGNFHCNGSLIGYDERCAGEGFGYEPPMQTLLLVDRKRGQTCKWPVYVESSKQ